MWVQLQMCVRACPCVCMRACVLSVWSPMAWAAFVLLSHRQNCAGTTQKVQIITCSTVRNTLHGITQKETQSKNYYSHPPQINNNAGGAGNPPPFGLPESCPALAMDGAGGGPRTRAPWGPGQQPQGRPLRHYELRHAVQRYGRASEPVNAVSIW